MRHFYARKVAFLPIWLWQLMPIFIAAFFSSVAFGSILNHNYLITTDNRPGAISDYEIGFTLPSNETLGSVEVQFCSNSPIVSMSCSVPGGMDISSATITAESGLSGFIIGSGSNNYTWILSNPATPVVNAGPIQFSFSGITNPTAPGSYYVRIQTFASSDASGSALDVGGIAFSINSSFTISTYVPPYLYFCTAVTIANYDCNQANGDYINFGNLSTHATSDASSQMVVATNAQNGYVIQLSGGSLTSGNNVLQAISSPSPSITGQNQFGLNLVANSQPLIGNKVEGPGSGAPTAGYDQSNIYKFNSGDAVASSNNVSDFRQYTVSYIINIANNQPPGVYTTTLTYVAIGNF